ncbi:sugar ABC transporter substrate-binding protein [Paenibacillus amylolyticus]|uniref:Sugar ABC transporter substrate-binding protein n=1 Tax=Paenibacillus amylolyticus TaxID=1451 RepID=A0A1R1C536_PAEAM|nr:sugar ABC transporter substrate-binding protein [Paenibacillus amylolyticus]
MTGGVQLVRSLKVWSRMMATVMALSLVLAACSSDKGGTTTPAAEGGGASEGGGKPYEVTLFYPGTPQKDVALVEAEINKKMEPKIGATLKINAIDWGQWDNKLNLMISSGEKSDIIFTAAWQNYTVNVAKGAFLPLNDLLDAHGQDIKKNLDPAFLEGSQVDGVNYGVPTNKELAATRGVLVRKDLADKYNLDLTAVKTWADLEPLLKTIKENEPAITPFYMSNTNGNGLLENLDWDYLGDASVPGVISKTAGGTTVLNEVETPEFKEAAELARKWYQAGYINSDAATSNVFPKDQAKAGKAFLWTDGMKPGKDKEEEGYVGFPLTQIEMTQPTITTGDASGAMLAISRSSEQPEKAMQVINLLHSDKEINNLLNFGIEGTHYVKKDGQDNIIALPDGVDANSRTYNPGAQWQLGNQFLNFLWDNEDPQKWEKFKEFNAKGVKSPALGFTFNSQSVKNEIAAVNNVNKQFKPGMTSGAVDPNEMIPKYLEKLKAAGIDKIIAAKQEQLDAFLAKQ